MDGDGTGSYSAVSGALDWVQRKGKAGDVVNMSMSFGEVNTNDENADWYYRRLEETICRIADRGIHVVISAGNDGALATDRYLSRIDHQNVYVVGSVDRNGRLSRFSNYDRTKRVHPMILAPGSGITSLDPDGQGCTVMSGTSMSAPHVSAILAMNKSVHSWTETSKVYRELKIRSQSPPRFRKTECTIL
jgi:subtilisin family serine protease